KTPRELKHAASRLYAGRNTLTYFSGIETVCLLILVGVSSGANREETVKSGRNGRLSGDGAAGVSLPAHHALPAPPSALSPVVTPRIDRYIRKIGTHRGWCFS